MLLVLMVAAAVLCLMAMTHMVRESIAALRADDVDIRAGRQSEAR